MKRLTGKIYETGTWFVREQETGEHFPIDEQYQTDEYYREIVSFAVKDGIATNIRIFKIKRRVRIVIEEVFED